MKKAITPVFYSDLEDYQMDMHTASGEKYRFILTGLRLYHPNMCSSCGYGSDDWLFHCKYHDEDCILRFSDDAGYGTMWDCAVISKADVRQLHSISDLEWLSLMMESKIRIYHLHPDQIDSAKEIVKDTCSRTGPISDEAFYGHH